MWQPVGGGTSSAVYALETFNGKLNAGGTFTAIGGENANYLARWNVSAWNGGVGPLLSGIEWLPPCQRYGALYRGWRKGALLE